MRRVLGWGMVGSLPAVALLLAMSVAASASPAASPSAAPTASAATSVTDDVVAGSVTASPSPVAVAGVPFRFNVYPFTLQELPVTERLFSGSMVAPREDPGIHDEQGVRMRRRDGQLYNFPRGQANWGIDNLNSYRLTGDEFYLQRSLAQANRLVSYHDEGGGAWYFPNYPSRNRHGRPGEFIQAPYYSALPEGRILLFFSRLAEITGSPKWREAADKTFLAFVRPGPRSGPYVLNIDARGYYWLQEWPWPGMAPDCTLNGHNSSLFGLFEYYMVTRDERAKELFRGAVTTVRHYLPQFRRDGWISCYCLAHRETNANYHNMHVGQLLGLYKMTGDTLFARAADAFRNDYPKPDAKGRLRVRPGIYRAVQVDADGRVVARRSVRVGRDASWLISRRQRLWRRSPVFLRADSGKAAGWWLPERPGKVWLQGVAAQYGFDPARTLAIAAGETCVAIRFDENGRVLDRRRLDAGDGLRLLVDRGAVINGYDRVRLAEGELDGYWLQLRKGLRLH